MTTATVSSFTDFKLQQATRAAVAAMGITVPTPIQEQAIPLLMEGKDVVGQAQTGSGKTLAFAIPIVERCAPRVPGAQALVLTPTRELAIQVGDVLSKLCQERRLKLTLLYGGRSLSADRFALGREPQVIVGTPGRVLDHLRQGTLKLGQLRILVLDEADEMLDRGFGPDVERIINATPGQRQTALFSATMPEWVAQTAARHLRNPVTLRVGADLDTPAEIRHTVYEMDRSVKLPALRRLLDERGNSQILVFGRTKHGVIKLARQLSEQGYPVACLQGNLKQNARERVMAAFRSGQAPILLATNVAARGLDVAGVAQVINFELPETAELFTHRAGRTGRMGRDGEAITFITPEDYPQWRQMERELGKTLPREPWPHGSGLTAPVAETAPARRPASSARRPAYSGGAPGQRQQGSAKPGLRPRRSAGPASGKPGSSSRPRAGRPASTSRSRPNSARRAS